MTQLTPLQNVKLIAPWVVESTLRKLNTDVLSGELG